MEWEMVASVSVVKWNGLVGVGYWMVDNFFVDNWLNVVGGMMVDVDWVFNDFGFGVVADVSNVFRDIVLDNFWCYVFDGDGFMFNFDGFDFWYVMVSWESGDWVDQFNFWFFCFFGIIGFYQFDVVAVVDGTSNMGKVIWVS